MAQQPKPMPQQQQSQPPMEHWPEDAKEQWEKLNALNDALTRVVNEQNRVIQSLRSILNLESEGGGGD